MANRFFCSSSDLHRILFVRASQDTFRRRVFERLGGTVALHEVLEVMFHEEIANGDIEVVDKLVEVKKNGRKNSPIERSRVGALKTPVTRRQKNAFLLGELFCSTSPRRSAVRPDPTHSLYVRLFESTG